MPSSDHLQAKKKINQATEWRGLVGVSFGDETLELPHRLLTESEISDLRQEIDFEELQEYKDEQSSDAHERLMELQSKDELTDEEKEEVQELTEEIDEDSVEDALGENAYDEIMRVGRLALEPTEQDVNQVLADPELQSEYGINESVRKEDVRDAIRANLHEMVEDQPYMIKFSVGMQAFMETVRVLGNGLQTET